MAGLSLERIAAPAGGLNVAASPNAIPSDQAPVLGNVLPGRSGLVFMRGPANRKVSGLTGSFTQKRAWSFGDKVVLSNNAGSHFWFNASGSSTSTAAVAATAFSPAASISGPRHARVGDFVYGEVSGATSPTLAKWDATANTIVARTQSPVGFTALKNHLNRLWVLGGSVPGTSTPIKSNSLYFTDPTAAPNGPSADTLAEYKDSVSGLVNQIVVGALDTPVGLARCGQNMAVLMRRSIYLLTGSGASTFAIRLVSSEFGCTNIDSIVEASDGFFFASDAGYCFCDGSAVTLVSEAISRPAQVFASVATGACAMLNGYVYVGFGANSSNVGDVASGGFLFHPAQRAWATINIVDSPPFWMLRTSNYVWANTAQSAVVDASLFTQRTSADSFLDLYVGTGIAASYRSRVAQLAGPGQMAQVQRVFLAHVLSANADLTTLPSVSVTNPEDGTSLTLTPLADKTTFTSYRRSLYQSEAYLEAADAQLAVDWVPSDLDSAITGNFEIHDAALQFQPGQNRGTL